MTTTAILGGFAVAVVGIVAAEHARTKRGNLAWRIVAVLGAAVCVAGGLAYG